MSVRANFADIYLRGMRDKSMHAKRNGIGARNQQENKANLSNRCSGVQISRDICTPLDDICTLRSAIG